MMANYPDELTCDMAETYGIFDIKRVPVKLLATLAVGLRDDSRVKRAKTGTKYDDNTILLARIADLLRWIQWSKTEDGMNGTNYPESIVDYLLGRDKDAKKNFMVFDSPEDFWAEMDKITRKGEWLH